MCRHELVCRKADQIILTSFYRVNSQCYPRWLCLIGSPFSSTLSPYCLFVFEVCLSIILASSEMLCPTVVRALFNSPVSFFSLLCSGTIFALYSSAAHLRQTHIYPQLSFPTSEYIETFTELCTSYYSM